MAHKNLDLSIFNEPDDDDNWMKRLAVCVKYHQLLRINTDDENARAILREFVDATYTRSLLLKDYIARFSKHSDAESRDALCAHLSALKCECSGVADCAGTTRHFRGRTESNEEKEGGEQGLFLDLIDTVHFNVFHLQHVGLRVPAQEPTDDADDDEKEQDADDLVDTEMRRIAAHIHRLRELSAFERIDNTKNSKFTIKASEENEVHGTKKGIHIF